jgi:N-acetylglutamate synthase-like GNAT family acetyltransferase
LPPGKVNGSKISIVIEYRNTVEMKVELVPFGSPVYNEIVRLRIEALLNPVGVEASYIIPENEKDDIFIAAMKNNRVIGCCVLTKKDDSTVQLRQMVVHPDYQGQGVGAAIVDFAEQIAGTQSYKTLMMHARDTAMDFYRKCGYDITGELFIEVGIAHHQMQKKL